MVADCRYSHTGEGLHRFVDPADDRIYLYSQFEVPDARRVFATFEQPDLKAVFDFTVTAPSHWKVVSNSATPDPEPADDGLSVWRFPTTERLSTYVTAVVAGEYHEVRHTYVGKHGEIPLGHYCRQSMAAHLDVDELVQITRQGFAFFEDAFDFPYPFHKYDQLYVPEFNNGAMENAGCIVLRDEYLPRSRQTAVVLRAARQHGAPRDGAHVVRRPRDHAVVGRPVAQRVVRGVGRAPRVGQRDVVRRGLDGLHQPPQELGLPPGPAALLAPDRGRQPRPGRRRGQLRRHHLRQGRLPRSSSWSPGSARTSSSPVCGPTSRGTPSATRGSPTCSSALEETSGRELGSWAEEWLQTIGVNTLSSDFEVDAHGRFTSFTVVQSAHPDTPTLRRHRIGVGLYDRDERGLLVRRTTVETDVIGERTDVAKLVGLDQPDLVLLNDGDLSYAKIRFDERSLATVLSSIETIEQSLARALCWSAVWDMTREAELSTTDFVRMVLRGLPAETDETAVKQLPVYVQLALDQFAAPAHRADLRAQWDAGMRSLIEGAAPGSDQQLTFVRSLAGTAGKRIPPSSYGGAARSTESLDLVEALLDGSVTLEGLAVSADLRWTLLTALAARGRADRARVLEELRPRPHDLRPGAGRGRARGAAHRGGQGCGLARGGRA